ARLAYNESDKGRSSGDSVMSVAIERGMRLHNAFNRETFVFSGPVDDPAIARFDVVLEQGGTGGGNALLHIHPYAEEQFNVRSGQIKVVVEGEEHVVGPGESFVVPRGKPHFFANVDNSDVEMTIEFTPAQQHLLFFANFASAAANQTQWFSKKGGSAFPSDRSHIEYLSCSPLSRRAAS